MDKKLQNEKGKIGEQLVSNFFDLNFSKFFSFPNPLTKSNAEVADVLIWFNWVALLIEVKTRDKSLTNVDSWSTSKIKEAVEQILKSKSRIANRETINLHNTYYQTTLDCSGISTIVGLIILVHEEQCNILPSKSYPEIYNQDIPIHVFSWNDLKDIVLEIDTVADLFYYLNDRFDYLNKTDIPLGKELNALGYYKSKSNKFPDKPLDFYSNDYWNDYKTKMAKEILARDIHNLSSGWLDALEKNFSAQRKLLDGYPIGLFFAWEFGAISRRERAIIGEKLDSVQEHFESGKLTREFAVLNSATGNWIVFYYSRSEPQKLQEELKRLVGYKLMVEIEDEGFEYAVYGFGFQVSIENPPKLLGLSSAIVFSVDYIKNKYTKNDLKEARRHFGSKINRQEIKIKEFPDDKEEDIL